jgi:hypothetical protein
MLRGGARLALLALAAFCMEATQVSSSTHITLYVGWIEGSLDPWGGVHIYVYVWLKIDQSID